MRNGSAAAWPGLRQFALSTPFWMRVAWLQSHWRGTQKRRVPLTEIQYTWFWPLVSETAAAPRPSPPRIWSQLPELNSAMNASSEMRRQRVPLSWSPPKMTLGLPSVGSPVPMP